MGVSVCSYQDKGEENVAVVFSFVQEVFPFTLLAFSGHI